MLTREQAKAIALKEILQHWEIEDDEPVIVDEDSIEEDFGWIFFYESRIYMETQIFSYCLAGNTPIIVNKKDGSVFVTGTDHPIEYTIEEYRKGLAGKPI
jgi:hypothetical protein